MKDTLCFSPFNSFQTHSCVPERLPSVSALREPFHSDRERTKASSSSTQLASALPPSPPLPSKEPSVSPAKNHPLPPTPDAPSLPKSRTFVPVMLHIFLHNIFLLIPTSAKTGLRISCLSPSLLPVLHLMSLFPFASRAGPTLTAYKWTFPLLNPWCLVLSQALQDCLLRSAESFMLCVPMSNAGPLFPRASVVFDLAGRLPPSSSSSLIFRTLRFGLPAISLAGPWGVFALLCPWPFPVGGSWDWVLGGLLLPMLPAL